MSERRTTNAAIILRRLKNKYIVKKKMQYVLLDLESFQSIPKRSCMVGFNPFSCHWSLSVPHKKIKKPEIF